MGEGRFSFALEFREMRWAKTLPNSTPHWSNESMSQIALGEDAVLVERDERAERCRRELLGEEGVRRALPSNTRCGTSHSGVPSALTASSVLPKASASAWAKTFASRMSWCRPSGLSVLPKAMKSRDERGALMDQLVEGVRPLVPGSPQ